MAWSAKIRSFMSINSATNRNMAKCIGLKWRLYNKLFMHCKKIIFHFHTKNNKKIK